MGREREREIRGKQTPGSTAPSSETKQKPEERRWRPAVWLGGRNRRAEKKNIAGEMGCVAGKRKKNYISPAGEMGCVAGEGKKNYILPAARWGAWPAREKKNYVLPAGEMGCMAGEGKKKIIWPARWLHVRRGKKNIIKIRNKKIDSGMAGILKF